MRHAAPPHHGREPYGPEHRHTPIGAPQDQALQRGRAPPGTRRLTTDEFRLAALSYPVAGGCMETPYRSAS
jgi:hypothetical protein